MCGRYALALVSMCDWKSAQSADHSLQRPSEVRQQLEQSQMPVEEAPNDDDVRQSYNFAPGYHGLVYRAETSSHDELKEEPSLDEARSTGDRVQDVKYKLQAMQWGERPSLLFIWDC